MKIPNNKIFYVSLILLFGYLSYDFIVDAKQDFFILNYNWAESKNLPIGKVSVVDYATNILSIEKSLNYDINNQKIYVVNNQYFFKAAEIVTSDNKLTFKGIHWINEYPRSLNGFITLSETDLKLIQPPGAKIAMIGDSQMGWREGKYTRKWIAEKLNVEFIGNKADVFGYPYFYDMDYNSHRLIENSFQLKDAKIIILFLGLRDSKDDFTSNLKQFVALNQEKIIILIHDSKDDISLDKSLEKESINVLYKLDISNYDKDICFQNDRKHLNFNGHKTLAEDLILKLKAIGVKKN